jgi:hypothetical protein
VPHRLLLLLLLLLPAIRHPVCHLLLSLLSPAAWDLPSLLLLPHLLYRLPGLLLVVQAVLGVRHAEQTSQLLVLLVPRPRAPSGAADHTQKAAARWHEQKTDKQENKTNS